MFSLDSLAVIRAAEIEKIVHFFRPDARILEIGAGTGQQALEISRRGFNVEAIEIPSSGYREAQVFPVVDYDGRRIPCPDASFDFVFSSNVLEHVIDLSALNREIRRVLRPGGAGLHVVPTPVWRFWTTVTLIPACLQYALSRGAAADQIANTNGSPKTLFYKLRRHFGRHGEHGTLLSEHWRFRSSRWREAFRADGFEPIEEHPIGILYTGNMIFGTKLSIARREALARLIGSSTRLYVVRPVGGR